MLGLEGDQSKCRVCSAQVISCIEWMNAVHRFGDVRVQHLKRRYQAFQGTAPASLYI